MTPEPQVSLSRGGDSVQSPDGLIAVKAGLVCLGHTTSSEILEDTPLADKIESLTLGLRWVGLS